MICGTCKHNWVRVVEGDRMSLCALDGKKNYGVTECSRYHCEVAFTPSPQVVSRAEMNEVPKLGVWVDEPVVKTQDVVETKRTRPKGWGMKVKET